MPVYKDDPTILGDAVLWRNVPPGHFVLDENQARVRPSSAAFDDDRDGSPMSVSLADVALAHALLPEDLIRSLRDYALAAITAALARECDQAIVPDRTPENPAHALVVGTKSRSVRKKLAKASSWVIPPPDLQVLRMA